jgi:DNA recombination protein Rad52
MNDFWSKAEPALKAPLSREHVKSREQSGRKFSYVEGWHAIAEANRIFGFGAWSRETVDVRCVSERPRKIGSAQRDGWSVSYVARIRVMVEGVVREGVGAGHGIDVDCGLAHESAIKEAETDAMKRALMTFGNPFGLALYDKEQSQVCDPVDDSLLAYRGAVFLAFESALSVVHIDQTWKEQAPQMKALGLSKDHPIYVEIVEKFKACKALLLQQDRSAA